MRVIPQYSLVDLKTMHSEVRSGNDAVAIGYVLIREHDYKRRWSGIWIHQSTITEYTNVIADIVAQRERNATNKQAKLIAASELLEQKRAQAIEKFPEFTDELDRCYTKASLERLVKIFSYTKEFIERSDKSDYNISIRKDGKIIRMKNSSHTVVEFPVTDLTIFSEKRITRKLVDEYLDEFFTIASSVFKDRDDILNDISHLAPVWETVKCMCDIKSLSLVKVNEFKKKCIVMDAAIGQLKSSTEGLCNVSFDDTHLVLSHAGKSHRFLINELFLSSGELREKVFIAVHNLNPQFTDFKLLQDTTESLSQLTVLSPHTEYLVNEVLRLKGDDRQKCIKGIFRFDDLFQKHQAQMVKLGMHLTLSGGCFLVQTGTGSDGQFKIALSHCLSFKREVKKIMNSFRTFIQKEHDFQVSAERVTRIKDAPLAKNEISQINKVFKRFDYRCHVQTDSVLISVPTNWSAPVVYQLPIGLKSYKRNKELQDLRAYYRKVVRIQENIGAISNDINEIKEIFPNVPLLNYTNYQTQEEFNSYFNEVVEYFLEPSRAHDLLLNSLNAKVEFKETLPIIKFGQAIIKFGSKQIVICESNSNDLVHETVTHCLMKMDWRERIYRIINEHQALEQTLKSEINHRLESCREYQSLSDEEKDSQVVEPLIEKALSDFIMNNSDLAIDRGELQSIRYALVTRTHTKLLEDRYSGEDWLLAQYPLARATTRTFHLFVGPTNSGKTYEALRYLKRDNQGVYLAPLRMMALENRERIDEEIGPCHLLTGEERIYADDEHAHIASTIEMLDVNTHYDVAIIDEAQMAFDDQRGSAWTRAILGVVATDVCLTLPESALEQMIKLIELTGDAFEVIHLSRKSPLICAKQANDLLSVTERSVVVVFSRQKALDVTGYYQANQRQAVCLYGSQPPELRKAQIERFERGEAEILVATDVIGMGVNLSTPHVIFAELEKFDGKRRRDLNLDEIKQIAGRAGRYGKAEKGTVGAINEDMLARISHALPDNSATHHSFVAKPETSLLLNIAEALNIQDAEDTLAIFGDWFSNRELFFADKLQGPLSIARKFRKLLSTLPLPQALDICFIPVDLSLAGTDELIRDVIHYCANGQSSALPEIKENETNTYAIEQFIKLLNAYKYCIYKFDYPHCAEGINTTIAMLNEQLMTSLHMPKQKTCSSCGVTMAPLNHHKKCDDCFISSRRRRYYYDEEYDYYDDAEYDYW